MKPNFSICLITKNEEKTLPRLLSSLHEFINRGGEVCILDTGSTDNTVLIAKEAGCIVEEVGLKYVKTVSRELAEGVNETFIVNGEAPVLKEGDTYFNFSAARNHASRLASNDFILSLDADEVLTKFNIDEICKKILESHVARFDHLQVFTHDVEGSPVVEFTQNKFYDRRLVSWQNNTHEMLYGDDSRRRISDEILTIEHFQNIESNRSGYIKGLAVDCYFHPEKDRSCHYFARELYYSGRNHSAAKEFKRHLTMDITGPVYDTTPTHMESMIHLGMIEGIAFNNPDKEIEWYKKAMAEEPRNAMAIKRAVFFYQWHKKYEEAKTYATFGALLPWRERYGASKAHFKEEYTDYFNSIISVPQQKIPKRIISMWIGPEMPEKVKECVATHKLEGYEHLWIDNDTVDEFSCEYLRDCISAENWGKASDYLRMAYLEKYGGIYLDADTTVLKTFDDVLDNELFVCEERNYFIANGIIGAVAHHPLIQEYLGKLTRNFKGSGELVFQPGMGLWTECIKQGPWVDKIKIYPTEWFLPYDWQTGVTTITENTHTNHFYLQSWKK